MISLKSLVRNLVETVVSYDSLWVPLSRTLVRGSQFLCAMRDQHEVERTVANHPPLRDALEQRIILAGPFKGMKYGQTKALCSALYPKLLGTYEHELAGAFNAALESKPGLVVDVGAADGYYAVGFAFRDPDTRIIAYDQDPRARAELAKLADLNGVADRIEIRGRCEPPELATLKERTGLMIVDCEGFEEFALSLENIAALRDWDFIIETHDGFVPGITKKLIERFQSTHHVEVIEAIHDFDKIDRIRVPLLDGLPRREADKVLAEGREHACLRWLVCNSRNRG
ncbi:MAG: hypothetical protein WEB53_17170 [Akkermansiaceae bacterium]